MHARERLMNIHDATKAEETGRPDVQKKKKKKGWFDTRIHVITKDEYQLIERNCMWLSQPSGVGTARTRMKNEHGRQGSLHLASQRKKKKKNTFYPRHGELRTIYRR